MRKRGGDEGGARCERESCLREGGGPSGEREAAPWRLISRVNPWDLAESASCDLLKAWSANGGNLATKNFHGWTLLHAAAFAGSAKCCEYLLSERPEDIEILDEDGCSPAHMAAWKGNPETCSILARESDPDSRSFDGSTPLHFAAESSGAGLPAFLKNGHSRALNKRDSAGETPAHRAARRGMLENLRTLIDWGADEEARNANGKTPEEVALSSKHGRACGDFLRAKREARKLKDELSLEEKERKGRRI